MQDISYIATLSNADLYKIVYKPCKLQENDMSWYHAVNELCNRDAKFRENYTKNTKKNDNQDNNNIDKMMSCLNI
jgi:hypothetical protein